MGFLLHWLGLFGFWLVLSGFFDTTHVTLGVLSTAAVALLSRHIQLIDLGGGAGASFHLAQTPGRRILLYGFWLLREVAVANWQVVRIVLDPRLPIDPGLVRFRTSLTSDLGITILANSITLTPGTVTVRAAEGEAEFVVHSLVAGEPVLVGLSAIQRQVIKALPTIESAREPAS